jgi:hypothetical protein
VSQDGLLPGPATEVAPARPSGEAEHHCGRSSTICESSPLRAGAIETDVADGPAIRHVRRGRNPVEWPHAGESVTVPRLWERARYGAGPAGPRPVGGTNSPNVPWRISEGSAVRVPLLRREAAAPGRTCPGSPRAPSRDDEGAREWPGCALTPASRERDIPTGYRSAPAVDDLRHVVADSELATARLRVRNSELVRPALLWLVQGGNTANQVGALESTAEAVAIVCAVGFASSRGPGSIVYQPSARR